VIDPDPFAVTADPEAYVPRPASEAALAALERTVRAGEAPCALTGPVGIGKSLLLRVLERRLADAGLRCVLLPYASLELEDLAHWALGLLGHEVPPGDDPVAALLAFAERLRTEGSALVLLLDDASALAPEVARDLVALGARSGGALRLVLVPLDDERAGRLLAALGPDAVEVRYREPLHEAESAELLRRRLAHAGAPPHVRERFDPATLARLHTLAAGSPRRLPALAGGVLRGEAPPAPLDVADGEREGLAPGTEATAGPNGARADSTDGGPGAAGDPFEDGTSLDPWELRGPGGEARPGRAAAFAAGFVLVLLALVAVAWWLGPTPPLEPHRPPEAPARAQE